jgi:hypothetical protein
MLDLIINIWYLYLNIISKPNFISRVDELQNLFDNFRISITSRHKEREFVIFRIVIKIDIGKWSK